MSASEEKRFDPTPTRRERARREGNIARSAELAGAVGFGAAVAALGAGLPLLATMAAQLVSAAIRASSSANVLAAAPLLACALLPACASALAATGTTLAQTGGLRVAPVKVRFSALAPHAGLKRMFGGEAAVGAVRAVLAFAVGLGATTPLALHVLGVALRSSTPLDAVAAVRDAGAGACLSAATVGVAFGLADYALVRRRWLRSLRMSFDELKRDLKEQDGDPHARARRRRMHRTIARGGMERAREASFVVVNPTHVAVALRYAPPTVPVPQILVRAADDAALAVRRIAERERIPVVEDVALARWLYRIGESGAPIPVETYVAVAEVIAALVRAGLLAE